MKKIILFLALGALIFFAYRSGYLEYLSFAELKARQADLQEYYRSQPWVTALSYFGVYVFVTALSLPGATILTLAGGAIFGFLAGTILVSFASTLGATLAFLFTRYLLRDSVEKKFRPQLEALNRGIEREGAFYLFTLRLVPLFPFFVINMLLGLTKMNALTFAIVSQVGMLLGTMVYVNAGTQIAQIDSTAGILSPSLLGSFVLLGIFPLIAKRVVDSIRAKKVYRGFEKPGSFDYNLVAIGAGSAGLVTAYIGAAVKARVALIEKHKMGGDCLNTGCVPSKALIKSAKVMKTIAGARAHGIDAEVKGISFPATMERVQDVIRAIEPHDSIERYESLGVECITGEAKILDPWRIEVNGRVITTKNIVLATGASPLVPPIPGLRDVPYLTSENLWDLRELPEKLLVLGGGPIGSEMAQAFARLGSSVTIMEGGPRLLSKEDSDVSEAVRERFVSEGINVLTDHTAEAFSQEAGKTIVHAKTAGRSVAFTFDRVIVALGRRANTGVPGLKRLGLELTAQKTFAHDEFLCTKYPNIFVCGDCAGPYQFTHTASHQAWYAAVNALFSPFKSFKVDYRVIPWVTFTDPEVGRVGVSEDEAKKKGIEYEVTHFGIDDLDRAIAEGEAHGFIKVLTKKGSDEIIGVAVVGSRAGEILQEFVLAMKWKIGLNKILGTIHPYPTFNESVKYVAGNWKRAHKPEKVLALVEKFHSWRRT